MGVAHQPPRSLSVHAQCFWTFTNQERLVMAQALGVYIATNKLSERQHRVARMLLEALVELSEQD